ncbi:MAG TPA: glycosyltransferase family 39 protein [Thermoanaerobaculia bacterium]|nr:glycosyltransferase family 39 protein [Thermoanaerobaculia bacterium]
MTSAEAAAHSAAPLRRRPLKALAGLGLLLLWSLGLRVWPADPKLTGNRFYDERYGVENLTRLLRDRTLRPANGFYPGLSYLPEAALLAGSIGLQHLTGSEIFAVFDGEGHFSHTGYRLCRLLQAFFGTLSIYLAFRIGRHLASPAVGLLAALLLAVVPWHLRQSIIFKPDILLVAACLLAFAASLWAAERPGAWRFLAAGAAIGVALGAKYNAGPIALPLVFAALAEGGWRDARRWLYLALAVASAIAVFLLSTPYLLLDPGLYTQSFGLTLHGYASKGEQLSGGSHLKVLALGVGALLSDSFHGPLIGAVGLLGFLLAAVLRPPAGEISRGRRLGPRMALVYVAGYAVLYCLSTTYPSEHNWLPLAPFIALSAAWTLLRAWDWLAARSSLLRRPAVVAAALVPAVALLIQPAQYFVYQMAVPRTQDLARVYLNACLQPLGRRVVFDERGDQPPLILSQGKNFALVREVDRLVRIPPDELDRGDAELFPAVRLLGREGPFYRLRLAAGSAIARFEPALLRVRGEALVVVVHPWQSADEAVPSPLSLSPVSQEARRLSAPLPGEARPREILSLEVWLPPTSADLIDQILIDNRPHKLDFTGRQAGRLRFSTDRFQVPALGARVTVVLTRPLPPGLDLELEVRRWRPGAAEGSRSASAG